MKALERIGGTLRARGLRFRVALGFVAVVGVSCAVLALGSYLTVRQLSIARAVDNAVQTTEANVALARKLLERRPSLTPEMLLDVYFESRRFEVGVISGDRFMSSDPNLDAGDVVPELPAPDGAPETRHGFMDVGGDRYLAVAESVRGNDLVFLFPERDLRTDLSLLLVVLSVAWVVVVGIAIPIGGRVARCILSPVEKASAAACAVAGGKLRTRLPEGPDEFGRFAASFNEMATRLVDKIDALKRARERERRFTSDVAHELRTPVGALASETSLLTQLPDLGKDARELSDLVERDVNRLRRLVEELLELSRLDADRELIDKEKIRVDEVVRKTLVSRGWEGDVRMECEPIQALSDPRRLERIVANLVDNAREHGRDDVAVSVRSTRDHARIEVSDSGAGIPRKHLPHIFERFYKADESRTKQSTGLGLAIAMENTKLLGGHLVVRTQPGKGTCFTLDVPCNGAVAIKEP